MTSPKIIPRELVAENLRVSTRVLLLYEARGLVLPVRSGDVEGYGPDEIRRAWTVLSLHRDAGINLAGIEAILKLRAHVDLLQARFVSLVSEVQSLLEDELGNQEHNP